MTRGVFALAAQLLGAACAGLLLRAVLSGGKPELLGAPTGHVYEGRLTTTWHSAGGMRLVTDQLSPALLAQATHALGQRSAGPVEPGCHVK